MHGTVQCNGHESDDAAYEVQADGKIVYIGEHFEEGEEDEVDQRSTSSCKRKPPTEKASTTKRAPEKVGTQKAGTNKASTKKTPRTRNNLTNMPKPLIRTKKAPSKKPPSATQTVTKEYNCSQQEG